MAVTPAINIETHFISQFTTNIKLLLQQMGSKLEKAVMTMTHQGEQAVPVEQVGIVNPIKRTTRYAPIAPIDAPSDRRWVYPTIYHLPQLIDNADRLKMLIDPTNTFAQAAVSAMGRAKDDEILAAFFGTSYTGKTGTTAVTFPAAQQVAVNFGANTNTGLTVAKLKEARRLLVAAEVDLDMEEVWMAINANQETDLLNEIQVVNADYNDIGGRPVLEDGKLRRFLGFNIIPIQRLTLDTNSYRRVPVWVKSGMHLGMWQDITTDIRQRSDVEGLPYQIYVQGIFGATRLEEKRLVEIKCSEA